MTTQMLATTALLCLLAGCGSGTPDAAGKSAESAEKTVITTASSGGTTTITTSSAGTVTAIANTQGKVRGPSEFQLFSPPYPGATIKTRVASASSEEGTGSMIAMHTPDDFTKVVAFYDAQAKQAGVTPNVVANEKDSAIRIVADEASGSGALIAISRDTEKPGTIIVITSGTDKGAGNARAEAAKVAASHGGRLQ